MYTIELYKLQGKVLRHGDEGESVEELQEALDNLGFDTNGVDGVFGNGTKSALKQFQLSVGLTADGVFGPRTCAALEARLASGPSDIVPPTPISTCDMVPGRILSLDGLGPSARGVAGIWNRYGGILEPLATQLGIPLETTVGVLKVESGGKAFGPQGKPIARFEPHKFAEKCSGFNAHFVFGIDGNPRWDGDGHRFRTAEDQPWLAFHGRQDLEWQAIELACKLNESAGFASASYGLGQVMGFNYQDLGFNDPRSMVEAFNDEAAQVRAFFSFVQNNRNGAGLKALRGGDTVGFAAVYNGTGQAEQYGKLIETAAGIFRQLHG